jgi:hypothetical protein
METLWSVLERQGMDTHQKYQLRGTRTIAGEQSLTVEHRQDDPRYVVTYRTYSTYRSNDETHVVLTWRIISVFSEDLAYITDTTTYNNDAPPALYYPQALRLKVADRVGDWLLPGDTHRASEAELRAIWKDIKTRERIS